MFVKKLQEEIISKIPSIKPRIIYYTKAESQSLVQLKCFVGSELPVQKANNLKHEISTIAYNLEHELSEMIAEARESVA